MPPAGCNIAIMRTGSMCVKRAKPAARQAGGSAAADPAQHRPAAQFETADPHIHLAAIVELVARTAIRPGSEQYARLRGTRGAATLLKSNVSIYGETVKLRFKAKGGKLIEKEVHAPSLAAAINVLRELPGRRLFQYRTEEGERARRQRAGRQSFFTRNRRRRNFIKGFPHAGRVGVGLGCADVRRTGDQASAPGGNKFSMRSALPRPNSAIRRRFAGKAMCTRPW